EMATLNSVFISYRPGDYRWLAQAANSIFRKKDIDVFFDIEALEEAKFETVVLHEIEARPFFMPILAANALSGSMIQTDWYLRALETALSQRHAIIPLYHTSFDFADIDKFLPMEIAHQFKNTLMFELTFDQLMVVINEYLFPFAAETRLSASAFVAAKQNA